MHFQISSDFLLLLVLSKRHFFDFDSINYSKDTGGTNQGPAYYQECVSLFGKKGFMKPVNE